MRFVRALLFVGALACAFGGSAAAGSLPGQSPPVPATHTLNGLMSAADKIKIDGLVTPSLATDLLRLQDIAVGNCAIMSSGSGAGATFSCLGLDGTSVGLFGSTLQRLALTFSGAITGTMAAGSGSLTTAFGAAGPMSVLANPTGSMTVPTFVGPATSGQIFQALGPSTLGFGPVLLGSLAAGPTNTVAYFNGSGVLSGTSSLTGLHLPSGVLSNDLTTGVPGGQSVFGGTAAHDNLTLHATSAGQTPSTFGNIYIEDTNSWIRGNITPTNFGAQLTLNNWVTIYGGVSGVGTSAGLKIGGAGGVGPGSRNPIDITISTSDLQLASIINSGTAGATGSGWQVGAVLSGSTGQWFMMGSNYTPNGLYQPGDVMLRTTGGGGVGPNLILNSGAGAISGDLVFATNDIERWRVKFEGSLQGVERSIPSTPAFGFGKAWFDSTKHGPLWAMGPAGVASHTVQTFSPVSHDFLTDIDDAGVPHAAQPVESDVLNLTSDLAAKALGSRNLIAGLGLTGGGDLTADRTFNVGANADGSIVVNANDIQVGVLATDAQHGVRGGGTQHAVATASVAGFESAADKTKLDGIASGATAGLNQLTSGVTAGPGTGSQVATVHLDAGASVVGLLPLSNITPSGTNTWVLTTTGGAAVWAAPASGGITQLTGDGTAGPGSGSQAFTLGNIPNGVTMAGDLNMTESAAPATPAASHVDFFADSTAHNGAFKNSSGTLTYGAQVDAGASHHFLTSFVATGAFTDAQPLIGDLGNIGSDTLVANPTGSSASPTTLSLGTTNGVLQYTHGSPDTLSVYASTVNRVAVGASGGGLQDYAALTFDGSTLKVNNGSSSVASLTLNSSITAGTNPTIDIRSGVSAALPAIQFTNFGGTVSAYMRTDSSNNLILYSTGSYIAINDNVLGTSHPDIWLGRALGTTDTQGFVWYPTSAGAPTGVPAGTRSTNLATEIDLTDDRFYVYHGSWKLFGQNDGALATGPICNTTSTGVHSACSAGNLAAAQTWPAATNVLVSTGTSTAPTGGPTYSSGNLAVGNSVKFGGLAANSILLTDGSGFGTTDSTFTFNPSTKAVSLWSLGTSSSATIGGNLQTFGSVTLSGYAGGNGGPLRIDGTGFMGVGSDVMSDSMHFYVDNFNGLTTTTWMVPGPTAAGTGLAQQSSSQPPETRLDFTPKHVRLLVHNIGSPSISGCDTTFAVSQTGSPVVASEVPVTNGTANNTYQNSGLVSVSATSTDSWGVILSTAPSNGSVCNFNVYVTAYFYTD